MATEYRVLGAGRDTGSGPIQVRIQVGKQSKYVAIDLTNLAAIRLAQDLMRALERSIKEDVK